MILHKAIMYSQKRSNNKVNVNDFVIYWQSDNICKDKVICMLNNSSTIAKQNDKRKKREDKLMKIKKYKNIHSCKLYKYSGYKCANSFKFYWTAENNFT